MRYLRFVIQNYRAITGPLTIEIGKKALIPIIGVNEAGKTTLLHAIFAFDYFNDKLNDGAHVTDITNLYKVKPEAPCVAADVELNARELGEIFAEVGAPGGAVPEEIEKILAKPGKRKKAPNLPTEIRITRNLATKIYSIETAPFAGLKSADAIAQAVVRRLPFILFFDDFRDKVDRAIKIDPTQKESPKGWLAILQRLFERTDPSLSLFDLPTLEDRHRLTVLAKVQRTLNATL